MIATCVVCNPWILDKLEPYVDGLTFQYTVSPVAMENALGAQMDVLSGAYNPTGKMSLTMVSSPEVIRIEEKELDGVMREVCVSPNDVPGYDKDLYMPDEMKDEGDTQVRCILLSLFGNEKFYQLFSGGNYHPHIMPDKIRLGCRLD